MKDSLPKKKIKKKKRSKPCTHITFGKLQQFTSRCTRFISLFAYRGFWVRGKSPARRPQKLFYQKINLKLLLLPLTLLVFLLVLSLFEIFVTTKLNSQKLRDFSSKTPVNPFPFLKIYNAPFLSAKAALIMDDQSKTVIFAKNAGFRFSMASTTKIMTALVALDYYKQGDVLTVYSEGIPGAVVGFKRGEKVEFMNVLYGMLLPSGNDAAYVLAENYPGGIKAFVAKMNEKAKRLRLLNTHYADPAGLNDDGDYTTAYDLAILASDALQNPVFAAVAGTKEKIIKDITNQNIYDVHNLNKLLGTDGVIGVKTGYTNGAGEVLVTAKKTDGRIFLIVVMNSIDRFADTKKLLRLIDNNLLYFSPTVK